MFVAVAFTTTAGFGCASVCDSVIDGERRRSGTSRKRSRLFLRSKQQQNDLKKKINGEKRKRSDAGKSTTTGESTTEKINKFPKIPYHSSNIGSERYVHKHGEWHVRVQQLGEQRGCDSASEKRCTSTACQFLKDKK